MSGSLVCQESNVKRFLPEIIVFIGVCIVFQLKFSFQILDVQNINWLMLLGSDRTPDFLAWEYYRITPWQFPIGMIEGYSYPNINSVGLTGAIPLFAIPFKLFNAILPVHFQYFGLWFFLCYLLQGFFAFKIFRQLGIRDPFFLIAFTLIVVLTPAFLDRTEHMNLCCHWVLLYAIWTYLVPKRMGTKWKHVIAFNALFALTHPYLVVFGIMMTTAIAFKETEKKGSSMVKALAWVFVSIMEVATLWYIVGNFAIPMGSGQASGFGFYSANLNSFFNSLDKTFFLPALSIFKSGQYEGFAYLGLGLIILFFIFIKGLFQTSLKKQNRAIGIAALLLFLFSLSNTITLFRMHGEIPLPHFLERLGAIFRSSGRYIWLANYLIIFAVLKVFYEHISAARFKYVFLGALFLVQVTDVHPLLFASHFSHNAYKAPLTKEVWESLISTSEKVNVYPPYIRDIATMGDFIHFVHLGYRFKKPISLGHLARSDTKQREQYHNYLDSVLQTSIAPEVNSLTISTPEHMDRFAPLLARNEIVLTKLDAYILVLPKANEEMMAIYAQNRDHFSKPLFSTLESLIPDNPQGWIVLSVKDEGTRKLCEGFQSTLANMGSKIAELQYRGSYLAIIHNGGLVYEKVDNDKAIEVHFPKDVLFEGNPLPVDLDLVSAGSAFGNASIIKVNGEERSKNRRGFNIVIFNDQGQILNSFVVDTFDSCWYEK